MTKTIDTIKVKELPKSFHLKGHTTGFSPQTQKLEPCTLYIIINSTTGKYCSEALIWMVTSKDFIHRFKS